MRGHFYELWARKINSFLVVDGFSSINIQENVIVTCLCCVVGICVVLPQKAKEGQVRWN